MYGADGSGGVMCSFTYMLKRLACETESNVIEAYASKETGPICRTSHN